MRRNVVWTRLTFYFKYVLPLVASIYPAMAVWGAFQHWPPTRAVFDKQAGQTPILIGLDQGKLPNSIDNRCANSRREYYVFFPRVLRTMEYTSISQIGCEIPLVSTGNLPIWALLMIFGDWILAAVSIWWFWFRPHFNRRTSSP